MKKQKRLTARVAVYLVLIKDAKVLLLRRFNTGWKDGEYSLISGHVEGNETVTRAMMREAKEEGNIGIFKKDLRVAHVMHMKSNTGYINFFLTTNKWSGEIKNREPDKCDDLSWFPLNNLPRNTLPHIIQALMHIKKHSGFSAFGWKET